MDDWNWDWIWFLFCFNVLIVRKLVAVFIIDNPLFINIRFGFFIVRFDIERWEHVGEEGSVEWQKYPDEFWKIAIWLELNLNCVAKDNQKLDLMVAES